MRRYHIAVIMVIETVLLILSGVILFGRVFTGRQLFATLVANVLLGYALYYYGILRPTELDYAKQKLHEDKPVYALLIILVVGVAAYFLTRFIIFCDHNFC